MKKINFGKIKASKNNKLKEKFKKEKKVRAPKVESETKKAKKKKKKLRIGYIFLIVITFFAICLVVGAGGFCFYIYKSAPEFNPSQLYDKEATIIYDAKNNVIATLGREKREKVTYDELPQVLVDAIIATEDSRFFQHNGFDLPRFAKATIGQLLGNSGAGGASTITMQVSKNRFTSTEASGIEGIIRKFTDIYLSIFKIEKKYTKEEIIEFYVNYPFLGSSSYGVEQASKIYFGKSVTNLSLPEAAIIAGLFQAPGSYDPYLHPDMAEARRNQVLNLMVRHGYIDKAQADAAKAIPVEDLLITDNFTNTNEFQGFINTVVEAVEKDTGKNAYDVPMIIHSTMDPDKQKVINKFYNGELGYKFKDDLLQVGIALIDNKTGALIAVGAGRNTKEMTFNYATMTNAHPGSTAKPIFEYGPGIEFYNWSTYTPFFDEKNEIKYSSGQVMNNHNGVYDGLVTLKYCLAKSKNTCALQAFQQLDNKKVYDFVTSIGIRPETNGTTYVGEAHSVGGFTGTSPVELAGAYQIFANGGYYTKPYSYTKVEFRESGEIIETDVSKTKVISPQTAYMISNILYDVTPSKARLSGTNVATKTGTSSYDDKLLKKYGLPNNIIRDAWIATYSPDYTMTFWYGYDALDDKHYACKCYNSMSSATSNRSQIQGILVQNLFKKNSKFKNPGGISTVEVEIGTIPAQKASEFTPSNLREKHLFKNGSEPIETSTRFSKLSAPNGLNITEVGTNVYLTWNSPGIPSAVDTAYLADYFNNGYGKFAQKYYEERLKYNEENIGEFGFDIYVGKGENTKYIGSTTSTSYELNLENIEGSWDTILVKSAYSKFKSNASDTISAKLSTYQAPVTLNISMKDVTITKGSTWNGSKEEGIELIRVNDEIVENYTAKLDVSSVSGPNGEIALQNIGNVLGDYTVRYLITFEYTGTDDKKHKYTQNASQSVKVVDPEPKPEESSNQ